MRVYITYRKDGYGDQVVDKVFSSHEKACQYIIEKYFQYKFYEKHSKESLMREAAAFVTEEEVI
jgi:hypothetical protein